MPGKIKEMIESIIEERSKGNPAIAEMTKAKLILKGFNPNNFNSDTKDDPIMIERLLNISKLLYKKNNENKKMNIQSVVSFKSIEEEIVQDIKSQLAGCNTKVLVYFASSCFNQDKLSALMQKAFINSVVFGSSTAGEIVSGGLFKNSVVAMSIDSNIIADIKVEVIEQLKDILSVESAFTSFEEYFNEDAYTMDTKKYVGIILIDGVSMKEEKVMDLLGDRTNVMFIGGSAGDDLQFIKTHVYANGKAYSDSAVLVMLKMNENAEFGIIKSQSFKVLDYVFLANQVNEETREVIEFNHRPAAVEYAKAVGAACIEEATDYFMTNPVGLLVGEKELFIRSPQRLKGESMVFYCNILEGMEVRLLESTNIIEDTRKALEDKKKEMGEIEGIINFNCIERTLELEKNKLEKQYGEIFKDISTVGFSTYGEEFIGHINQTATMLVFKSKH